MFPPAAVASAESLMSSPSPFARSRPGAIALLVVLLALAAERPAADAGRVVEAAGAVVPVDDDREDPGTPSLATPIALATSLAVPDPDVMEADTIVADALAEAAPDTVPLPPVQFLALAVDGGELPLAYLDVAPVLFTGRTVVLLHGRLAGEAAWSPTIAALGAAGFRVIVPDLPGVGRSGRSAAQLDADDMAAHVELLLDSLDAPAVSVVAHGAGAAVALELAAASARVERLALARPDAAPPAALAVPTLVVDAAAGERRLPALLLGFLDR